MAYRCFFLEIRRHTKAVASDSNVDLENDRAKVNGECWQKTTTTTSSRMNDISATYGGLCILALVCAAQTSYKPVGVVAAVMLITLTLEAVVLRMDQAHLVMGLIAVTGSILVADWWFKIVFLVDAGANFILQIAFTVGQTNYDVWRRLDEVIYGYQTTIAMCNIVLALLFVWLLLTRDEYSKRQKTG